MRYIAFLLFPLIAITAVAGELDNFEASANKPQKKKASTLPKAPDSTGSDELDADIRASAIELTAKIVGGVILLGTAGSLNAANERLGSDDVIVELPYDWSLSDMATPFVQVDLARGSGDHIEWRDKRIEAGFGPVSAFHRKSVYQEPDTDDEMYIINNGFNYRLLFGKRVEVDLGIGRYRLTGNQRYSSESFQFGLNIQITDNVWLDYNRTSVSGRNLNLADSEYAVLYGVKHIFLSLAYRSLDAQDSSLDGLVTGITLLY
ncbi:hypothetical protein [Thalassolituus sp. C2-1]|uniref:hypothetical protein n=1 Tax=Venatorbacter sp. C2-1 TaxID=2597518 RepID=UPI001195F057|nr:hypothetical protein [Thalassolituus sp. C2-1]TVV41972.1 hypothetical protein FOT50_18460 [Thalassolituus sp. C2-1]